MNYDKIYKELKDTRFNGKLIDIQKRYGVKKNIAEKLVFALEMNADTRNETVVGVLSDVHFGEMVFSSSVLGLNHYNTAVAEQRIHEFFEELRTTAIQRNAKSVKLLILGDMISGMIHDELVATNDCPCVDQVEQLSNLLTDEINKLYAANSGEVYSTYGNHGRVTQKLQHKYGYNNFDTFLGYNMKHRVPVPFHVLKDEMSIVELTDTTKAIIGHGTFIRPSRVAPQTKLFKALDQYSRVDSDIKYLIMGHLHNYIHFSRGDGRHVVVNGSIIGPTEFSIDLQFFGDPSQTILVLDADGGLVYSKEVKFGC